MTIKTVLIILHLVGLVVGLGAATVADMLFMRCLLANRMTEDQYASLKGITDLVIVGLLILGVTGTGFIALYHYTDPHLNMNPKMWAKLGIILVLSMNGFFMHDFILPLFARNLRRPLFSVPSIMRNKILLFGCGAISMTSWYAVLVLGVWKDANFKYSYWEIFSIYLIVCTIAVIASPLLGRVIVGLAQRFAPAVTQEVFEGHAVWGGKEGRSDVGSCYALLRKEMRRSNRQSEVLTVFSIQVGAVTSVTNDLGSLAAQQLEKELTALVFALLRDHDHLGVLGGGKYLVILPSTDEKGAEKVVSRVSRSIASYQFDAQDFAVQSSSALSLDMEPVIRRLTCLPAAEFSPEELMLQLEATPGLKPHLKLVA